MKSRSATPFIAATPPQVLAACAELGLPCDAALAEHLCTYLNLLQKWNARMNLVGVDHWRGILSTLVADSWSLAEFLGELPLPESPQTLDLGAGAGLPGVPLRLLWQKGRYTMVELRAKRAMFLQQVLAFTPLPGVDVYEGRAEDAMAALPPGKEADLILSRAFMPWRELIKLVADHLAPRPEKNNRPGVLVILANEAPQGDFPSPWTLLATREYTVDGKARYFWALTQSL